MSCFNSKYPIVKFPNICFCLSLLHYSLKHAGFIFPPFLIISLFLSPISFSSFGQQYNFKTYSVEDGLSQVQVLTIIQDSKGYLWFGTAGGGVNKFDGINFTSFTANEGLCNNSVNSIIEDSKGNLWFGTNGGGVSKFDGNNFINYNKKEYIIKYGLLDNTVWSILEDSKGNIWFGNSGGLSCLPADRSNPDKSRDSEFSQVFYHYSEREGLGNYKVLSILEDNNGKLWFGTEGGGVIRIEIKDNSSSIANILHLTGNEACTIKKEHECIGGLSNNNVYSILQDKQGNIWFATDGGLNILRSNDISAIKSDSIIVITEKEGLSSNKIRSICEEKDGIFWIGTWGDGVNKLALNSERSSEQGFIRNITHFSQSNGLCHDFIYAIFKDREKNFWFGTFGGVTIYQGQTFIHFTERDGLLDRDIFAIMEDSHGIFWIGTWGGDVFKYFPGLTEGDESKFEHFIIKNGFKNNIVKSILEDRQGNIWFAMDGGGVSVYDGSGFRNFTEKDGLGSNSVQKVIQDSKGIYWFATHNGLSKYDPNRKSGKKIENFTTTDGLSHNDIYQIHEDKMGNIWIATWGGGVNKLVFSGEDYSVRIFTHFTTEEGLSSNYVRTILEDKDGNLWLATKEGVDRFDPDELAGKFINFSVKDGLSSNTVYLMLFDEDANIWIGTNRGLDKFDVVVFNNTLNKYDAVKSKYDRTGVKNFKHYGKLEGFKGIECSQNAVCKDTKGNLWFGNQIGVSIFNPEKDKPDTLPPVTHISNLRLFFKDIDWANDTIAQSDSIAKWHHLPVNLRLPYYQNHLTFDFLGISMTIPEKVRYQFKLEGLDKDWSPATKERFATYSNLLPGKYTFMV
ncbi:MAG: two-component regulator propeller domain-containing protein, partial [Bacteroidota bacterium]